MKLNSELKDQIMVLLEGGLFQKDIVNQLGISPKALSKELEWNKESRDHKPEQAHIHFDFNFLYYKRDIKFLTLGFNAKT